MFTVPLLVIILENERFYKFSSIFEMNYLVTLKVIVGFIIRFFLLLTKS